MNEENEEMGTLSMSDLSWNLPLFDNPYLSMQGQNIMLVDFPIGDMEKQLLQELTPGRNPDAGHDVRFCPKPDVDFCNL